MIFLKFRLPKIHMIRPLEGESLAYTSFSISKRLYACLLGIMQAEKNNREDLGSDPITKKRLFAQCHSILLGSSGKTGRFFGLYRFCDLCRIVYQGRVHHKKIAFDQALNACPRCHVARQK
jgi:hypothetical protein